MMTEKYPTWLTGHVKEWAEKRLPTRIVTIIFRMAGV